MRTLHTSLLSALTLISLIAIGCETTQVAQTQGDQRAEETPIESSSATLVVHGMGCPLCANNVDKQLLDVPGVTGVDIDLGSGTVNVQLAETNRPTQAQLAQAVEDSGFTLVSIATP